MLKHHRDNFLSANVYTSDEREFQKKTDIKFAENKYR